MHTAMTREQRRLVENMRLTAADYGAAARARDEYAGGMQWLTVKNREYLTRYRRDPLTGEQKSTSMGARSPETEAAYSRYMKRRSELDGQMSDLRPDIGEQARLAKALRLNRAPEDVGAVARAIGLSGMFDHVTIAGDAAVFAYECEMAALLPREFLPEGGVDLLVEGVDPTDTVDELAAVLRRSRIDLRRPRVSDDRMAVELRTDEGLKLRLFTVSAVERMIDHYADEDHGGAEAARWALEQPTTASIVVDRQGRAAPVKVLDPRAWCILRCMATDMEEMSVIRREEASELVSAMVQMVQERWPQPFEAEQVQSYGRLHGILDGGDFFPPPRI